MFKKIHPKNPIIAVDFDGTVVEDKFPELGSVRKKFKDWYKIAKKFNCVLILWTCREGKLLKLAKTYLEDIGCPFDYYNKNNQEFEAVRGRKLPATVYIDDRAGFMDWESEIVNLKILLRNWKRRSKNV